MRDETTGDSGVSYETLVLTQNLLGLIHTGVIMSLEEAQELYLGEKRPPKLLRILRALWRVKDA